MNAGGIPHVDGAHDDQLAYERFCRAALRLTGVDLTRYRQEQTERRVRALAQRRGADSLLEYLVLLRRDEAEREIFRDRVTINVSQLWRNPDHWDFLAQVVLPQLVGDGRRLSAWSAGCSYGAEPYTLAMLWRQIAGDRGGRILGTDIDRASIERARRGVFSADDARDVPLAMRRRWLVALPDDTWQVAEELRPLVAFETGDVFATTAKAQFDLALCRNLVIYLTPANKDRVHELLTRALRPGGYLMIGATERISHPERLGLETVHPFVYRKTGHDAAGAP